MQGMHVLAYIIHKRVFLGETERMKLYVASRYCTLLRHVKIRIVTKYLLREGKLNECVCMYYFGAIALCNIYVYIFRHR